MRPLEPPRTLQPSALRALGSLWRAVLHPLMLGEGCPSAAVERSAPCGPRRRTPSLQGIEPRRCACMLKLHTQRAVPPCCAGCGAGVRAVMYCWGCAHSFTPPSMQHLPRPCGALGLAAQCWSLSCLHAMRSGASCSCCAPSGPHVWPQPGRVHAAGLEPAAKRFGSCVCRGGVGTSRCLTAQWGKPLHSDPDTTGSVLVLVLCSRALQEALAAHIAGPPCPCQPRAHSHPVPPDTPCRTPSPISPGTASARQPAAPAVPPDALPAAAARASRGPGACVHTQMSEADGA